MEPTPLIVPIVHGSIIARAHDDYEATVTVEWSTGVAGWDPACLATLDCIEENAAARGWRVIERVMPVSELAKVLLRKSGTWEWAKNLARTCYGGPGVTSELDNLDGRDKGTHVSHIELRRSY